MMLIISIIIAVWLAKSLVDILIGLAEVLYGVTLLVTAGLWYFVSGSKKTLTSLWKVATDQ
jgi:hypothetical protein